MALLFVIILASSGCRAIRRHGESRQSIAAKRLARQGLEAMHRDRWEDAEELFAGAIDLNASDDRANWGLAESLWRRGEREEAIEYMQAAVRLSGSHPELVVRLGRMHWELDQLEAAEELCAEALLVGHDLAGTWALHGDCLSRRGHTREALAAYHRALALQPDYPEVQIQAAELYRQQGRYDRLLATLDRLRDELPSDSCPTRVHMLRGIAMRQLGRPHEASSCFAEALQLAPEDPNVHLELAALALHAGDFEKARDSIDEVNRIQPASAPAIEMAEQMERRERRLAGEASSAATKR